MIPAIALLGYAALLAGPVARNLTNAPWSSRAPRSAIAAWHALVASIVTSFLLVPVAIWLGLPGNAPVAARLLRLCAMSIRAAYGSPAGLVGTVIIGLVFAVLLGYVAVVAGRYLLRDRRTRHDTATITDLIGRRDQLTGATIIEHEVPYAFCVPGRQHRIVITSAAVVHLADRELSAVLAHERAHLRAHHHLALAPLCILRSAFRFIAVFRLAEESVAALLELAADDAAIAATGRSAVRDALLRLAEADAPRATFAASAIDLERRLRRLDREGDTNAPAPSALRTTATATGAAIAPIALLVMPALIALATRLCMLD